jgi:hypothetical protein
MAKTRVAEWNLFKCLSCEGEPEFTPGELREHLKTVHNITEAKGNRRLVFHLDGSDFFQSDYEWKIGDVKLAQQVRCKRRGLDKALWAEEATDEPD